MKSLLGVFKNINNLGFGINSILTTNVNKGIMLNISIDNLKRKDKNDLKDDEKIKIIPEKNIQHSTNNANTETKTINKETYKDLNNQTNNSNSVL